MLDHTGIGVADVSRSGVFYDCFESARITPSDADTGERRDRRHRLRSQLSDGLIEIHPHSVRQHTAFAAKNRSEVDAFYAAALKAGGTDNGAPGPRRPNYYAAFVLDPDGNNIEAVFRGD
jgi:catechol 2,3-dioxygenase-like lactoylglutathione lyase family enzyme